MIALVSSLVQNARSLQRRQQQKPRSTFHLHPIANKTFHIPRIELDQLMPGIHARHVIDLSFPPLKPIATDFVSISSRIRGSWGYTLGKPEPHPICSNFGLRFDHTAGIAEAKTPTVKETALTTSLQVDTDSHEPPVSDLRRRHESSTLSP